jgi:hypothetical protein
MQWKSPEPARLHEIARHFREFAGATCSADYIRMMIRTAEDLDSLAANLEGAPESMPRAGAPGGPRPYT